MRALGTGFSAEVHQGSLAHERVSPDPLRLPTRILEAVTVDCVVSATGWNYLLISSKRPVGVDFWCCDRRMTDNVRRLVGLLIAPLLILVGLWLCLEGLYGKLSDGFWVGPFVAIAGGLWLASDWFEF